MDQFLFFFKYKYWNPKKLRTLHGGKNKASLWWIYLFICPLYLKAWLRPGQTDTTRWCNILQKLLNPTCCTSLATVFHHVAWCWMTLNEVWFLWCIVCNIVQHFFLAIPRRKLILINGPYTSCHVLIFSASDFTCWLCTTWVKDDIAIISDSELR